MIPDSLAPPRTATSHEHTGETRSTPDLATDPQSRLPFNFDGAGDGEDEDEVEVEEDEVEDEKDNKPPPSKDNRAKKNRAQTEKSKEKKYAGQKRNFPNDPPPQPKDPESKKEGR